MALFCRSPGRGVRLCTKVKIGFLLETYAWQRDAMHVKGPVDAPRSGPEEPVSLTFERRLILSSLSSRTRKLGGTYQKQTFVC